MQCHGVNGLKSFRARRDGKGPIVALALEHPRRRPCPLALRPRTPSRTHTSWPQGHLSLPLPRHPQGFHSPFFVWQRSAHHGQPCPLLSHTVGEHKGERGASYQKKPPLWLECGPFNLQKHYRYHQRSESVTRRKINKVEGGGEAEGIRS